MVDLKAKPFYLTDAQIQWVEDTIAGMTLEEKLGQLFVILQAQPGCTRVFSSPASPAAGTCTAHFRTPPPLPGL